MGDPPTTGAAAAGFSAAGRLIELAEAVRADPALPRDELATLLARHGEHPADLAPEAFGEPEAAELRAAARRMALVIAETDEDRVAEALNGLLEECGTRPRLTRHDGHPWHLHVDRGDGARWGDWLLASGALALAQLLTEYGRIAWGACAAPGCGRLFLGTGPGSARRYCTPTCATRARVAAHRRRRREAAAPGRGPGAATGPLP
ncbi:putative stress-induced transcription regulator [Streptomyces sp. 3211.6]|uniref:CGNR zinc finger domain-containing protein n=1 Tax=Streptomyces sp. 3211.6 TaxID=1938845 RepID=UPI000EB2E3CE|nr:CGNR zinc finger domain-containing protein [Streptomyces sp. 3211.6]RKT03236.1 putative stress-induced transcription regulator [Streptomyces sp. 3211.6]